MALALSRRQGELLAAGCEASSAVETRCAQTRTRAAVGSTPEDDLLYLEAGAWFPRGALRASRRPGCPGQSPQRAARVPSEPALPAPASSCSPWVRASGSPYSTHAIKPTPPRRSQRPAAVTRLSLTPFPEARVPVCGALSPHLPHSPSTGQGRSF